MENNNITEQYIAKMSKNRKLRTELFDKLRNCHNKLIIRYESIKSIIQYTAIYLAFAVVNIGISMVGVNIPVTIILGGLTVGYIVAVTSDIATIIKNKPEEIYKSIAEYNGQLSDLDNEYISYSNEIELHNSLTLQNKLYLGDESNKSKKEINKQSELIFSDYEDEKAKVIKYSKK